MTAARQVLRTQPPPPRRGLAGPRDAHWRDALARAVLATVIGALAGAALGLCCGIRTPATEAPPAAVPAPAVADDVRDGASWRQPQPSVAAVLAPSVVVRSVTADHAMDAPP